LKKTRVVIYGNSLFLDGVEANLSRRAEFALSKVDSAQPEALSLLLSLEPDVVIFDAKQEQSLGALLHRRRSLLLIGLDLRSKQAAVLTNRQRRVRRADDLVDLILRPD
jgi:hypothetical protein